MKNCIKLFEIKKIQTEFPISKISCSKDAADFARLFYGDDIEIFESCFILLLNRANKTTGYAKISQGGITGTVIDIKIVAKYAVESMASSVIIFHNHPSGQLKPSESDLSITQKLKKGLALLDVILFDHIILTVDGFYSLADNGSL